MFVVGRMVSANFIKESKSAKHHKRSMMKSYKASHPKKKNHCNAKQESKKTNRYVSTSSKQTEATDYSMKGKKKFNKYSDMPCSH